jgi:hypothetical protein
MGILQDRDLTALGGSWATTAFQSGNPDGYVTDQGQADFAATFGDQVPAERKEEEVITPYEGLVAMARAFGIPGDQFGAFFAFLQQQGVDVPALADQLGSQLTYLSAPDWGSQDRAIFDASEWLKAGFSQEHPGLVEQFQQAQAQPTQAAA